MKKALLVLVALCMAGVFSAKAQSPSDSAYARDLSYTFINTGSLPVTVTDSLINGGKYLKDIRIGKRAKGYAFTLTSPKCITIHLDQTSWDSWDEYLFLLDANFNEITHNDDASGRSGSFICKNLAAGSYYILATEFSASSLTAHKAFDLTLDEINVTPLNQLTYTAKTLPFTVRDTFRSTDPYVILNNNAYKAKGYSFQGTQGKFLMLDSISYISSVMLMDNNFNKIALGPATRLSYTGTYYLVVGASTVPKGFSIKLEQIDPQTVYIDGVNGSDSRNGLTPQTALFTLDTAIARTRGIGKYYITDDYTFRNEDALVVYYAEIYPYQKDIKLKIASTGGDDIIGVWPGHLVFGEQGSSYYFILDSNSTQDYDDFLDADYYGSYLEVNNLKARNTHFPSQVFWGDQVVLRNCEFVNDSIGNEFITMETYYGNSVKFVNCNISQNHFGSDFIYFDYDSAKVTFENTTVTGNTFEYPLLVWGNAEVNLTSGSWSGNTLSSDFSANGNPNISRQTAAGIWAMSSTVNFGVGFSMDANNFLCIDTASILNVNQNITASSAATVYPWKIDPSTNKAVADYYEGRTLLSGSAVAANYRKFSVAQADNSTLWYLHSDGKIYTTEEPVSIDQAEEGIISLYPNPASDVLNIALQGSEVNEVVVIDIYGKAVAHATVAEGSNTMDISALPAGMYFVQLRGAGNIVGTHKIVKK